MHELSFSRAARPTPTAILGLTLKPFSIGHQLCLIREGNPLADGKEGKPQDLAGAVLICHHSWEELKRVPFDPLISFKLWGWRRRTRKMNFGRELAAWLEYRDDGCREFPLSDVVHPGRSAPRIPGTPFILRLHQFVWTHFKLTEAQAWDFKLGEAKMRWCCHWEQEGGLEVYNVHDAERDRQIAELERKFNGRSQ